MGMARMFRAAKEQRKLKKHAHPECASLSCQPDRTHGSCHRCGAVTCGRSMLVDPESLRRRRVPRCWDCKEFYWMEVSYGDHEAKERRARLDWELALPDQFPGRSRTALGEFFAGDAPVAKVKKVGAMTLNQSLASLGLHEQAFAEVRSGGTFLRRVKGKRGEE